jgi:glutathione synthase/RimK-type ligase-like ATP-grasp enzyme
MATARPIGIYYEHPDWFRPLFNELDRRGVAYEALNADRHAYDATNGDGSQYGLVFNRMSPSAHLRGRGHSILYTLNYLAHLEQLGVRVVNGLTAFRTETSKALQLSLLKSLDLAVPGGARDPPSRLGARGGKGTAFPIVVKANIGGSGAGIVRFDTPEDLERAVAEGRVQLGLDGTALVQEFIPGERRPHHPRRGARLRVSLRDQRLQQRRELQPVPG